MVAGNKQVYSSSDEQLLMARLWSHDVKNDPLAFVMYVFPWGQAGTPLEKFDGPRQWQRDVLAYIADHLKRHNELPDDMYDVCRMAVSSGRGIGKSALVSWIILWMMSTRLGASVIVSANSESQLRSVTWGELSKWHAMAMNKHWFDISATRLVPAEWFGALLEKQLKRGLKYYYAEGKLWNEENPDAFAGVHNHDGVMVIFDEASGIADCIWDVTQGFFTEPIVDRYWLAFSNPRRNEGAFFECFNAKADYWESKQIDSRTVEGTDKRLYERIIAENGADSRQAKVEVYGQFPDTGEDQFISPSLVDEAIAREVVVDNGAPLLMGVDVARFGDDSSVIAFRRGRDARSIPWRKFKGLDTVQLVGEIVQLIDMYKPDAIFVDGAGVGGGVVDQLKALRFKVIEVQAAGSADDKHKYLNKRVECWDRMREWLSIAALPHREGLKRELVSIHYRYTVGGNQLALERKDELKKRILVSPDESDALAQTFARSVARNDMRVGRRNMVDHVARDVDFDVFS